MRQRYERIFVLTAVTQIPDRELPYAERQLTELVRRELGHLKRRSKRAAGLA